MYRDVECAYPGKVYFLKGQTNGLHDVRPKPEDAAARPGMESEIMVKRIG